ncbi:glycerol-3-phosphate dehydrogenase/oxidase [Ruegeria jejuensis]|uniref:glycerol-3-phosphate dehydrogenase/oxidase n=1 Tax=Ruegeria jejuensis TaxID=3233338 RepID=UPI00355C3694
MRRDISLLRKRRFDVVVVGGGIQGACVARDAALRGLSVALIEQGDFCGATSHNSLKTIHGGIRYLQHLNFKRAIESIREQQIFLRTAPHLVQPLGFLMPTYGYGMRGPLALGAGIALFEALNAGVALRDGRRPAWPKGQLMRAATCRKRAPGIDPQALTGGAYWADAQVGLADKAVLQILQQAVDHGACVANDVQAEQLRFDPSAPESVCGLGARDMRTGDRFEIAARAVVNATGPWAADWIRRAGGSRLSLQVGLVKSMNLVTRKPALPHALAVKSSRASDSRIDTAKRMFFVVPWQGRAVIGTTHFTHRDTTLDLRVDQEEIAAFVEEFAAAFPAMGVTTDDILYCYQGLTPGDDTVTEDGAKLHESRIVDHATTDGIGGVFSIVSIKWTTARLVAEQAVDRLLDQWKDRRACQTRHTRIPDYPGMPHDTCGLSDAGLRDFVVAHVENTQAFRLDDIVLRRTNDLVSGRMSAQHFAVIEQTLADHFNWSVEQRRAETQQVLNRLPPSSFRHRLINELEATSI